MTISGSVELLGSDPCLLGLGWWGADGDRRGHLARHCEEQSDEAASAGTHVTNAEVTTLPSGKLATTWFVRSLVASRLLGTGLREVGSRRFARDDDQRLSRVVGVGSVFAWVGMVGRRRGPAWPPRTSLRGAERRSNLDVRTSPSGGITTPLSGARDDLYRSSFAGWDRLAGRLREVGSPRFARDDDQRLSRVVGIGSVFASAVSRRTPPAPRPSLSGGDSRRDTAFSF